VPPTPEAIRRAFPQADPELVEQHLRRLPERYFESYAIEQIARHIEGLQALSPAHPVELLIEPDGLDGVECTVLAFDYPSEFSLITGLLASAGFGIRSGGVFTYSAVEYRAGRRRAGAAAAAQREALLRRRRIVDHFVGVLTAEAGGFESFAAGLRAAMAETFALLERGKEGLAEAKKIVNEKVAESLATLQLDASAALYPVHMDVDEGDPRWTRFTVVAEDTPFFLSSFSTALALRGVSIEQVAIRTYDSRIEDTFDLADTAGGSRLDPATIDQVRLSVLLTKQFTYFLTRAPDPYMALTRFENLIEGILELPQQGRWIDLLSNPRVMEDLAKLLGTSDFLWEDFIRTQYESLLPMLGPAVEGRRFATPPPRIAGALRETLTTAAPSQREAALNAFKDREAYLIDLDNILSPAHDFRAFSEHLTRLAEAVVQAAFELAWTDTAGRHGAPMTVAGLEARYAILGVGKLGGEALGYASDIEFIFVYSDSGQTAGPAVIANAEFFELLVQKAISLIHAKREGIFQVDLRLRPHGNKGPLAVSLDSFSHYYDRGGPAHSFERLALVRMRSIGGDAAFGGTLERLRDRMVYSPGSIRLDDLRALRERQLVEKSAGAGPNTKFSRGGLVDLEYAVQMLQVMNGGDNPRLRTPSVHKALDRLAEGGVIRRKESEALVSAYRFLRNLINALRMLRGSAQDLFLPPKDSIEFSHVARRMGYARRGSLPPETALYVDFETATASVRAFVDRYFGQATLHGQGIGNVADLVLAPAHDPAAAEPLLRELGFADPVRALANLRALAGPDEPPSDAPSRSGALDAQQRDLFARLAVLACDFLSRTAAPDMALNNWERFVEAAGEPVEHFRALLAQPMGLDVLLRLFASSQFLSDTLIRNPAFLPWLTDPANVHTLRDGKQLADELRVLASEAADAESWRNALRRFRRREILRTGVRDLVLGKPLAEITTELTRVADAITRAALDRIWATIEGEDPARMYGLSRVFCILAFGKLGGSELNYSSDIDLVAIYQPLGGEDDEAVRALYDRVVERLREDLARHTAEGTAYRVDLRLRPYGSSGILTFPLETLARYYRESAALWEVQALLKARPIAGGLEVGARFLESVRPLLLAPRPGARIAESIERMRDQAVHAVARSPMGEADIKSGLGGIRDLEFLIQGLQLAHAPGQPELLTGNSLDALRQLEACGVLSADDARLIRDDYTLLRRVEHALQVLEDQQRHSLPTQPAELRALARRVLGPESDAAHLQATLAECQARVRARYTATLAALRAL
jgi:[glutamine synthetase] adenylyltransferase / [glutamine synthetase]-adenylyl-L-tyrosine phosphorylase